MYLCIVSKHVSSSNGHLMSLIRMWHWISFHKSQLECWNSYNLQYQISNQAKKLFNYNNFKTYIGSSVVVGVVVGAKHLIIMNGNRRELDNSNNHQQKHHTLTSIESQISSCSQPHTNRKTLSLSAPHHTQMAAISGKWNPHIYNTTPSLFSLGFPLQFERSKLSVRLCFCRKICNVCENTNKEQWKGKQKCDVFLMIFPENKSYWQKKLPLSAEWKTIETFFAGKLAN
jgi:hypothetical protein